MAQLSYTITFGFKGRGPGSFPSSRTGPKSFKHGNVSSGSVTGKGMGQTREFVGQAAERSLIRKSQRVVGLARSNIYARTDTSGRLPASIRFSVTQPRANELRSRIGSNLPHALWVEEGTARLGSAAHGLITTGHIYPKTAKVLRFRSWQGGPFIFAWRVSGQLPKNYLIDALEDGFFGP